MANKTYKPLLIDSILATANLPKQRFISFTGGVCTAGEKALGVSDVETDIGQYAPVGVVGILLVEAGGEITQGSAVTSDANGKAVTATDDTIESTTEDEVTTYSIQKGTAVNGYALDAATASGDIIRIARGI